MWILISFTSATLSFANFSLIATAVFTASFTIISSSVSGGPFERVLGGGLRGIVFYVDDVDENPNFFNGKKTGSWTGIIYFLVYIIYIFSISAAISGESFVRYR